MNITFTFLESLRSETSPESLSKMQLWGPKYHTKGVEMWKLRYVDILAFIHLAVTCYIIRYIYIFELEDS